MPPTLQIDLHWLLHHVATQREISSSHHKFLQKNFKLFMLALLVSFSPV